MITISLAIASKILGVDGDVNGIFVLVSMVLDFILGMTALLVVHGYIIRI